MSETLSGGESVQKARGLGLPDHFCNYWISDFRGTTVFSYKLLLIKQNKICLMSNWPYSYCMDFLTFFTQPNVVQLVNFMLTIIPKKSYFISIFSLKSTKL